jgi:hypothetical protein
MDLVQVEILGLVVTHRYGSLKTGDILRTDAAYAKHLVEDCAAAKYVQPVEPNEDGKVGQDGAGASDTSNAGGEQKHDAVAARAPESSPASEHAAATTQPAVEAAAKPSRKAK